MKVQRAFILSPPPPPYPAPPPHPIPSPLSLLYSLLLLSPLYSPLPCPPFINQFSASPPISTAASPTPSSFVFPLHPTLSIPSPPTLLYPLFYHFFSLDILSSAFHCTSFTIPSPSFLMYPLFFHSFSHPSPLFNALPFPYPFSLSLQNFLCTPSPPLPFHSLYPFRLPFIFFYINPSSFPCTTLLHPFSPFPPKSFYYARPRSTFLLLSFISSLLSNPSAHPPIPFPFTIPMSSSLLLFGCPLLHPSSPSLCSTPAQVIFTLFTLLLPLFYLRRYIFTSPSSSFPFTYPSPLFTPFLYTLFFS
jgi:hypothetical protein